MIDGLLPWEVAETTTAPSWPILVLISDGALPGWSPEIKAGRNPAYSTGGKEYETYQGTTGD